MSDVRVGKKVQNARATQNIVKSLYPAIFFLKVFGIWHYDGMIGVLYKIYGRIVLFLVGTLYATSMLMSVFEVWGNLPEMADAIYLLVTIISLTLKFALLNYKQMIATIRMLDMENFKKHTPEQDVLICTAMNKCVKNTIIFQSMCTIVCWSWSAMPLINGTFKLKKLPLKGWYPYKTDTSPVYEFTYMYQVLGKS